MNLTGDALVPVLLILIIVDLVLIGAALVVVNRRRDRPRSSAPDRTWEPVPLATTPEFLDSAEIDGGSAVSGTPVAPSADEMPIMTMAAHDGRDELTGLLDPASWARLLEDEGPRVKRYHRPVAIVLLELEGLDRLTAKLGPEASDRLLPAMADTLRRLARQADHVARLDDGRFGVFMPETDEVTAINYVERIRRACELWLESGAIALRLAIGWAATTGDLDMTEVQRLAAERMYVELRRVARRDVGDAVEAPAS